MYILRFSLVKPSYSGRKINFQIKRLTILVRKNTFFRVGKLLFSHQENFDITYKIIDVFPRQNYKIIFLAWKIAYFSMGKLKYSGRKTIYKQEIITFLDRKITFFLMGRLIFLLTILHRKSTIFLPRSTGHVSYPISHLGK